MEAIVTVIENNDSSFGLRNERKKRDGLDLSGVEAISSFFLFFSCSHLNQWRGSVAGAWASDRLAEDGRTGPPFFTVHVEPPL